MRKIALISAVLVGANTASLLPAAPPSGSTLSPQISYVRSARGYDLIVANEDGSGVKTVYSSAKMLSGELGPDGNIYFWEGGRFNRMPAAGGPAQLLFDTFRTGVNHSDLSPNGASVAWFSQDAGALFRYDIISGQQAMLAAVPSLIDLTFDYT